MQTIMKTMIEFNEVSTTITIEEYKILTSRIIGVSKMVRLYVELDGTMQDMIAKCERISKLTNEMYTMLSEVQNDIISN